MHKRCSGISRKLRAEDEDEFKCRKCDNGGNLVHPEAKFVELYDGSKFECVDKFCYLGDMLSAGGGAEEAAKTRVRSAWGKFNELAPILTKRGASMKLKGRIYDACVQRVLVYGSETGDESRRSGKANEDREDDGEKNVWSVFKRPETKR